MVVSGDATVDGRPLLWKNRDSWQPENEVVYFDEGGLKFLAIVNCNADRRVWMGVNVAGFCIENSLSRDLSGDSDAGPGNGRFMKLALGTCTSVADFERLLRKTNETGRRTQANFGVIDACGGAAVFEAGPSSFSKFDAADQETAPQGIVVRANFSVTARGENPHPDVYSVERFRRASHLAQQAAQGRKLDIRFLLRDVARDLTDQNGQPLPLAPGMESHHGTGIQPFIDTASTLNRRTTVSAVVFQGVRPGEDPSLATMWVLLGQPVFSVAVPCWVKAGMVARELGGPEVSSLCAAAVKLRDINYDAQHERLRTAGLPLICRSTFAAEDHILRQTQRRIDQWRMRSPTDEDVAHWHRQMSRQAWRCLDKLSSNDQLLAFAKRDKDSDGDADGVHVDFQFEDDDGTRLAETADSTGSSKWNGGLTDSSVLGGRFRIRRNATKGVNRYVDLDPNVRVGGSSGEQKGTPRGWLVMESSGWNLQGQTANELIRFGFTSRAEENLQTAGFVIARTEENVVSLSGRAFGDGGSPIETNVSLPARQLEPVTLAIELDKVKRNSGEGDAGGVYRLYLRMGRDGAFKQVGDDGHIRRLRNGNYMHLRVEGFLGAREEFFDIDRVYYTTRNPVSR